MTLIVSDKLLNQLLLKYINVKINLFKLMEVKRRRTHL